MVASLPQGLSDDGGIEESLLSRIADDLLTQGYCIRPVALPHSLTVSLDEHLRNIDDTRYTRAGIGRGDDYLKNRFVRTDEIFWITGESPAERQWLEWTARLQTFLNRRLFLGLYSFESHFAHYAPGDYYKRHYDAFHGQANRILSIVVYLNNGWVPSDGGELVLYLNDSDQKGINVVPLMGTIVVFLSEKFPHEVLPAKRDRHSIAGWFRVNSTTTDKVDPPR